MKVIHILPYSSLVTGRDFEVDLFADGFHVSAAQQVWKRTQKYQLECWRPERKLKQAIAGEKDGITYRSFPSFRPSLGSLDKFVYKSALSASDLLRRALVREYSLSMLKQLKRQCQDEEVLIHLYRIPCDLSYLICLCFQNVPILGCPIGGALFTYSFLNFIYNLPLSLVERKALKNIDRTFVGSKWIFDILSKLYSNPVLCMPIGVDFEEFKPLGKQEARSALGIPPNKRVMLHVGRFDLVKRLDIILEVYDELKSRYDMELVVVGGLKSDPLYNELIKSGAIVCERLPHQELIRYYSAADVYLTYPAYYQNVSGNLAKFGGPGIAIIESLACGTPAVGANLMHFLGTEDELKGVGRMPASADDAAKCVAEVLEHPQLYQSCREIARKYYGWENIVERTINIYDELFEKYYR